MPFTIVASKKHNITNKTINNMPYIKPYTSPQEIFKILANAEAEIEHSRNYQPITLPKYTPPKAKPKRDIAGWYNFVAVILKELKP